MDIRGTCYSSHVVLGVCEHEKASIYSFCYYKYADRHHLYLYADNCLAMHLHHVSSVCVHWRNVVFDLIFHRTDVLALSMLQVFVSCLGVCLLLVSTTSFHILNTYVYVYMYM